MNKPAIMTNITPLRPARSPAGSAQYRMVARGAAHGEIYLYGIIGLGKDNWLGIDGVTAKQFAEDLKRLAAVKTIDLRINSDGGVVDDARAIYNLLAQHPAEITVHIDGIAASAASFVAMVGKTILIAEGGWVMVHNARGGVYGTADDLKRMAEVFEGYNQSIRDTYAARTKQSNAKLKAWMDEETWFSGKDAVKAGFADRIVENVRAVAINMPRAGHFIHIPVALRPNRLKAAAALAAMKAA